MTLLKPAEPLAAKVINPGGDSQIVLACEHASRFIPKSLNGLGLGEAERISHAAWDPGALDVAKAMSKSLDCPLVTSGISRLVYDCNRPPGSSSATPERSELIEIPGNRNLDQAARKARFEEVYLPFRTTLADVIANVRGDPVLVTVHSFTPVYYGKERTVEIGFLHDLDDRLAVAMLNAAASQASFSTALNEPYDMSDGVTHTLREHAIGSGMLNVMIEIRNDLIDSAEKASNVAKGLVSVLQKGLDYVGGPSGDMPSAKKAQPA